MRADVHMHTSFSHDSEAEPREMIEGAIAKGLEVICFTDHYDKDYMGWGDESIFDADAYFGTLRPLQEEYRDRIDIRIGVELGMQPRLGGFGAPIPTDLGALFPRPKRDRSETAEHPLIPRTEF